MPRHCCTQSCGGPVPGDALGRVGCTAGPIPAEQRGGAPAGHDPEGQRFPQRSRCPRWAVAAPDGRSSPRSQGGPARQRPQHPCGERQPSGAVSGPAPPPFHGHPLSDMAACLPACLPPSFLPSLRHGPARTPRAAAAAAAAAMFPRPAYGSRRRSGRAALLPAGTRRFAAVRRRGPLRALSKMAARARDPLIHR